MNFVSASKIAAIAAFAFAVHAGPARAGAPANDECAGAIPVNANQSVPGSTLGATASANSQCGQSPDVWYSYTATATGAVEFDLCTNTDYDSRLGAYDACGGALLACNDDSCGLQSRISVALTSGQTILIQVGGFGSTSAGNFELRATPIVPPDNDDCAAAVALADGAPVAGRTSGATQDGPVGCGGGTEDVWYSFTATNAGLHRFTLCNDFPDFGAELSVLDGCGGTVLACDRFGCGFGPQIDLQLSAGQRVLLRVAGVAPSQFGSFTIQAGFLAPPANDDCADAAVLPHGVATQGRTVAASQDGATGCAGGTADVWYSFTANETHLHRFTLCEGALGFPAELSILDACGGTVLACDEFGCGFAPQIDIQLTQGQTVLLRVATTDGRTGDFSIRGYALRPTNDACADATTLFEGPFPHFDFLLGATQDGPTGCAGGTVDAWYRFTPQTTQLYRVSLCDSTTNFDTELSIFDSCGGTVVACNDDGGCGQASELTVVLQGGVEYRFRVAGVNGATGDYAITVVGLGIAAFGSDNYQTFLLGAGPTNLLPFTIVDSIGSGLAANDLRVTIPESLGFTFDPSANMPMLQGGAAAKVAPVVSFENGDRTVVFDIMADFSLGDDLRVSGLVGMGFGAETPTGSLIADFGGGRTQADSFHKQVNRTGNYVTSDDNQDPARTRRPDGDFDQCLFDDESLTPIELTIQAPGPLPTQRAQLLIGTNDVDFICGPVGGAEGLCQVDEVYLNGNLVGILTGIDSTDGAVLLEIPDLRLVQQGDNDLEIRVDTATDGSWCLEVQWAQLIVDGGSPSMLGLTNFATDANQYDFGNPVRVDYEIDFPGGAKRVRVNTAIVDPQNTLVSIDNRTFTVSGADPEPQTAFLSIPASGVPGAYKARIVVLDDTSEQLEILHEVNIFVGSSPTVDDAVFTPAIVVNDGIAPTFLTARVDDPQGLGDIASVTVDLTDLGGGAAEAMRDDGQNGDATAGDGVFTFGPVVSTLAPGLYDAVVTATDANGNTGTRTATLILVSNMRPTVHQIAFDPPVLVNDGTHATTIRARVSDPDGLQNIVRVTANLSAIGGEVEDMFDDGTNGDNVPGDGIYSYGPVQSSVSTGFYSITVGAMDQSTGTSASSQMLQLVDSLAPSNLRNLSNRGGVGTGDRVMIAGIIVQGTRRQILFTGIGPDLANFGVPNVLADPELRIFQGQTEIGFNDNWRDAPNAAAIEASGFRPNNDLEAAVLLELDPGEYTAILTGVSGGQGNGLVQVWNLGAVVAEGSAGIAPPDRIRNLSTRQFVGTGAEVLISGIIVEGQEPKWILVRGIGPSLVDFSVPDPLRDPHLRLFQDQAGAQVQIGLNDDWQEAANAATVGNIGFGPANPDEAAILIRLNPGSYTAILSGADGGVGNGLVEVYDVTELVP